MLNFLKENFIELTITFLAGVTAQKLLASDTRRSKTEREIFEEEIGKLKIEVASIKTVK